MFDMTNLGGEKLLDLKRLQHLRSNGRTGSPSHRRSLPRTRDTLHLSLGLSLGLGLGLGLSFSLDCLLLDQLLSLHHLLQKLRLRRVDSNPHSHRGYLREQHSLH
jgi:hypothetical protein